MASPSWLRLALSAAFLAVAGYCVVRLVAANRVPARYHGCHRTVDVAHMVMALGMAVMCSPIGGPMPAAGWQTVFLLVAAWSLGSSVRRRRAGAVPEPIGWHGGGLNHAVAALAMLYMLIAIPDDARHMSHSWMGPHVLRGGPPVLGWALAGYFAVYAVFLGPRLLRAPAPAGGPIPAVLLAPRITATCQLIMVLGAGYLIVPLT